MMTEWEEEFLTDWLGRNMEIDPETGKNKIKAEELLKLKLDDEKKAFVVQTLKEYDVEFDFGDLTTEERIELSRKFDFNNSERNEESPIDVPKYSKLEFQDGAVVAHDFTELNKILDDFIKENIRIRRINDKTTGAVEILASVPLHKLLKLGLSEDELAHAFEYLEEDHDVIVRGTNSTLDKEFDNYEYISTYKNQKLPKVVEKLTKIDNKTRDGWFADYKRTGDQNIRNLIFNSYIKFVPYVTYKIAMRYGFDINELNQYGYIAMMKAIDKFDNTMGYSFTTYAYVTIMRNVLRAKAKEIGFSQFKKYTDVVEAFDVIRDVFNEMGFDREASEKEVIQLLTTSYSFSNQAAQNAYNRYVTNNPLSLNDYKVNLDENETEYSDEDEYYDEDNIFEGETASYEPESSKPLLFLTSETVESNLDNKLLREDLDALLKTLTPREELVLRLRFGFDDGNPKTLEEIGEIIGVTRERIRQIEAKAIRKLRHPSRSKKLKDWVR